MSAKLSEKGHLYFSAMVVMIIELDITMLKEKLRFVFVDSLVRMRDDNFWLRMSCNFLKGFIFVAPFYVLSLLILLLY